MKRTALSDDAYKRIARIIRSNDESEEVKEVDEEKSSEISDDIVEFFAENPNPSDDLLHEWAEEKGFDPHDVEGEVYKFATFYINFLTGGKANETGFRKEDVDEEQLKMGIEVELEHTPDREVAERIALDHLAELPDYYTKLKEMEG